MEPSTDRLRSPVVVVDTTEVNVDRILEGSFKHVTESTSVFSRVVYSTRAVPSASTLIALVHPDGELVMFTFAEGAQLYMTLKVLGTLGSCAPSANVNM